MSLMIDTKRILMPSTYLLIFLCLISLVSAELLSEILSPFKTVNINAIYNSYSSIIDFVIYLVLFLGLSHVTIGKQFDSRGGRAMVIAVGFVLAIGLSVSETYLGFNLRSFGPLAAMIFIFLFGLVIFLGIKSTGMEIIGSASITIVLTYFSIRSVAPSFFDWMAKNQYLSWIHSVILIAILVSIYKIIKLFFPKRDENISSSIGDKINNLSSKPREFLRNIKEEKDQKDIIRKDLEKITSESGKNSKQIIEDLQEIKILLKLYGNSEKGRELISKKIGSLIPIEKGIHLKFKKLNDLIKPLSNLDIKSFKNLSEPYKNLLPPDQKQVDKTLQIKWENLNIEKQMLKLEESINKYDQLFSDQLELLIQTLKSNNINKTFNCIDQAIKIERTIQVEMQLLESLSKRLGSFSNLKLEEIIKS